MRTASILLSLLAIAPSSCVAQQGAKEAPKAPFVLEAGEVQLPALVDRCATYLGRNVLMNAAEMQSSGPAGLAVRLQHKVETDPNGCEELLTSMLYRAGFALVQLDSGSMFEVVSMNGPRGREVLSRAQHRTIEQVLARPNLKVAVTVTVPLQHINATIATNALRPFFASSGAPSGGSLTIGNVGNNSSMLLSGYQDQVAQAIRLVRECDVPGPKMAASTEELLNDLLTRLKALEEKVGGTAPKNAPK
jgi:type II secretory pathway component GspD/PulD (secretin)